MEDVRFLYMNNIKRIGVIIQGPLVSFGQGPNNSPTGFETDVSLDRNLAEISKRGFDFIVVLWTPANERESAILKRILMLTDDNNIVITNPPKNYDPDHRFKQIYGANEGFKKITSHKEIDYWVRIRIDMVYPNEFWDFIGYHSQKKENKLLISELFNCFYFGDFVFGGNHIIFKHFLNTLILYQDSIIHPCIAMDFGMKYMKSFVDMGMRKISSNVFYLFFFFYRNRKSIYQKWESFVRRSVDTIPKEIWEKIIWRNNQISKIVNSDSFCFDSDNYRISLNSFIESIHDLLYFWIIRFDKTGTHKITRWFFKIVLKQVEK